MWDEGDDDDDDDDEKEMWKNDIWIKMDGEKSIQKR